MIFTVVAQACCYDDIILLCIRVRETGLANGRTRAPSRGAGRVAALEFGVCLPLKGRIPALWLTALHEAETPVLWPPHAKS